MTMTNQEINERVAKLCGWKYDRRAGLWRNENKPDSNEPEDNTENAPNYAESLGACREFETAMDAKQWSDALLRVIQDKRSILSAIDARYLTATATPLERCEAFLRMKGQWE